MKKNPDAGKDGRKKEKRAAGDEMVGWYQQLSGHELEKTLGDSNGEGRLVCYSLGGHKGMNMHQ